MVVVSRKEDIPRSILERLGKSKRLILIEISKGELGYKKLSKKLGLGLDTIRSHIRTGKHSTSLFQLDLILRDQERWIISELGKKVLELLKQEPEYSAHFYDK
ncbi:hypothetical protein ES705_12121 [subsurface metagenome]